MASRRRRAGSRLVVRRKQRICAETLLVGDADSSDGSSSPTDEHGKAISREAGGGGAGWSRRAEWGRSGGLEAWQGGRAKVAALGAGMQAGQ